MRQIMETNIQGRMENLLVKNYSQVHGGGVVDDLCSIVLNDNLSISLKLNSFDEGTGKEGYLSLSILMLYRFDIESF